LFDIFTSHHSSGLDVIAAPRGKFNFADLTVAALDALFDMASTRYDLILIDLPVIWFPWTFDIIANADALVVTGINTISCLHQIVETLAAVRSSRTDTVPVSVVINRCERRLFGGIARHKHVQQVLGREKIFFVQDDPVAMVESVNTGTPIVVSRNAGKAVKQIAALASYCGDLKSLRQPREQLRPQGKDRSAEAKTAADRGVKHG
jgi:pilus assembly protein CpaE